MFYLCRHTISAAQENHTYKYIKNIGLSSRIHLHKSKYCAVDSESAISVPNLVQFGSKTSQFQLVQSNVRSSRPSRRRRSSSSNSRRSRRFLIKKSSLMRINCVKTRSSTLLFGTIRASSCRKNAFKGRSQ